MAAWDQERSLLPGRARAVYPASGYVCDVEGYIQAVQYASADASAAGDNELVAAQGAGKKIRVLAADLNNSASADTLRFRSGTTAISGLMNLTGACNLPYHPHGWFETAANEALNLNLTAGLAAVGVILTYVVIE